MRLFRADKKLSTLFFSRFLRYNIRMKNRTSTWIFFFLFVLNASGVFAAMVENPRQGLVAISVTSHPAFSLENSEQRQGLTRVGRGIYHKRPHWLQRWNEPLQIRG